MRKLVGIIFSILIVFLAGCGSPQSRPASSTPSQVPTRAAVTPPPSVTLPPSETAVPTAAMPAFRTPQVREALPASGSVEFHILHWNDFHGELVERYNEEGNWIPGAARLAVYVNTSLDTYGRQDTLLLDAGDWFENTEIKGERKLTKGLDVLALYQRLGVDAITVGNHDLFLGVTYFTDMVARAAPMQILSVNLRKAEANGVCTDEPIVNPYQVYELGEPDGPKVRVAVIGISMQRLEALAFKPILGLCFQDPLAELQKIYDELMEKEKPDVVVLLSHSGLTYDRNVAKALNAAGKSVDLIIGGHSHTWMQESEKIGNTTIVQAGDYGRAIGDLDLTYNRATSSLRIKWHLSTFTTSSPQDPGTLAFLTELKYASGIPTPGLKNPDYKYLIDLKPASQSVGFWSLGKGVFPATDSGMTEGQLIYSHGKQYPYGLFAHAPARLRYILGGQFKSFVAEIGIKETACGDGASFSVSLDKTEIFNSGTLLPSDEPRPVNLDVRGGQVLELTNASGTDMDCDWTIWGDPYLIPIP